MYCMSAQGVESHRADHGSLYGRCGRLNNGGTLRSLDEVLGEVLIGGGERARMPGFIPLGLKRPSNISGQAEDLGRSKHAAIVVIIDRVGGRLRVWGKCTLGQDLDCGLMPVGR